MHVTEAKERLDELIGRVGDWNWHLAELEKLPKTKYDKVHQLLQHAELLLIGDNQDLAYKYVRAAITALEVIELEDGE